MRKVLVHFKKLKEMLLYQGNMRYDELNRMYNMFNSDIRKNITEETKVKWNKRYKEYLPKPHKEVSKYFFSYFKFNKKYRPPHKALLNIVKVEYRGKGLFPTTGLFLRKGG